MAIPNILYIHSHDTGRYVQPYGHAIPTPNIQRLAEEGVLFRQTFCAAPTCSPSRAALLTGQCPHSAGLFGLAHRGYSMPDFSHHLVHTLRPAGYLTALAGVQHVAREDGAIGYDRLLTAGQASNIAIANQPTGQQAAAARDRSATAPAAAQFLKNAPRQPFFLDVGFSETHRHGRDGGIFNKGGPVGDPRYCPVPAGYPDVPQIRQDVADFAAAAARLDQQMGMVFDALSESGLAQNTLVICTTDHGIPFPGCKCNLNDRGMGVMLILRGPGGFTGGKVCDALVSQIDLFPTICDLIGIAHPSWLEGRSLLPLMDGRREEVNEEVFAEVNYHAAYEPMRAVRTRRWKYIRRFHDHPTPITANWDEGLTRSYLLEHGLRERRVAEEELHDLIFDPHEAHNLANDPAHARVLEEMRGRLRRWMERTNDPLLRGPIAPPKGARVNDPKDLSPTDPPRAVE